MQGKSKLSKAFIFFGVAVSVQTLTFYTISEEQLKTKLLPEYFQIEHKGDSAYVQDFFGPSEDPPLSTILSHDLRNDTDLLEERLGVTYILFAERSSQSDPREKLFNVVYHAWAERGDWYVLSNFYKTTQVEHLTINKERRYTREVRYQWFLFFWIKSFEFIQSEDLIKTTTDG